MKFYTPHSQHLFSGLSWRIFLPNLYRYTLASVLVISDAAKLIDASDLLAMLQQLSFMNERLMVWIATLLPVVELGLAIALFIG